MVGDEGLGGVGGLQRPEAGTLSMTEEHALMPSSELSMVMQLQLQLQLLPSRISCLEGLGLVGGISLVVCRCREIGGE